MPVDGAVPLAGVALVALAAWRARAVSASGALAGAAVGVVIAAGAGWPGFAMLAVLLLGGTLVSARGRRNRSALQVLCNGGVAAAAALAAGSGAAWGGVALAGALSAALSDTVSGEVGQRWGGRPRLLLFGPARERGTDGGMTWRGTLAGIPAAALVPLAGRLEGQAIFLAAAAGLLGNLLDSVLGHVLQPRLGGRGNDWINLLATASAALLAGFGARL